MLNLKIEKRLPSSNLYSHPGKLLEDHLVGVAFLAERFAEDKAVINKNNLKGLVRIIALSHDVGKATQFFQDYLKASDSDKERLKKQKETHHGLFSALCAYYLSKDFLTKNKIDVWHLPFFAFVVVKRHHGDLQDSIDEAIFNDKDQDLLEKQLESIENGGFSILAQHLMNSGLHLELTKDLIEQWNKSFASELRTIKQKLRQTNNELHCYFLLNLLYSLLLDADKSNVVIERKEVFKRDIESLKQDLVNTYKAKKCFSESPVNELREKAYQEIVSKELDLTQKIYSINLPTGLGKTLISLSFALKLRQKIRESTKEEVIPRVIYALPFLSIIEQNANELEVVLKSNGISPDTNILLKHHHLSEVFYKIREDEFEPDAAKILIEGWNSEIVVTTFIQLFHTIVSNRNKSIRKFHRLANSIIILDEVQAIPHKYWLLVKAVLETLTREFLAYIVFVTATEPLIFGRGETIQLVEKEQYFSALNRVVVKPILERDITLEELLNSINIEDDKRYLFVFNTINSAKCFYELIRSKEKDIVFLSTHIIPRERLNRVNELKNRKYKIAITTQLVEAGVDIDFDVVVRDLAPLDSINQAAGRCNRNGEKTEIGEVYVISLKGDNSKKFATCVYDSVLLDITKGILEKYKKIQEKDFVTLIKDYYEETSRKKSKDEAKELLEAIVKLKYDRDTAEGSSLSIADFRLIEEDYDKKDVFIEIDEQASMVWQKYIKLEEIKDPFKRKRAFDHIKAEFYQYVISVPSRIQNLPSEVNGLGYVKKDILGDYYNLDTGFITRDTCNLTIW